MREAAENSYIAFISYRHKPLDKKAAELIQKKIENYTIPRELRESPGAKHFGRCFRDEDELPASASLSDSIYEALDASEYLIVICTPDLPESAWCEQEIRYFLKTHDRDHVIAALADGDPAESFSPLLLHTYDEEGNVTGDCEPLAANIAGPGKTIDKKSLNKESVRIFAALLGCPFDALWQRERRAKTLRLLTLAAVVLAVVSAFLIMALNSNAKINEQNKELSRRLSTVNTDSGFTKLEKLEVDGAIADGLAALESGDPEIYDHRAIKLLGDALGAYKTEKLTSRVVYEQQTEIEELWVSADEKHVLLLDSTGTIHCLSTDTYTEEWRAESSDPKTTIYADFPDRILYRSRYGVAALSLQDGSELWRFQHDYLYRNYFQALSPDGSVFAVLDKTSEEETEGEKVACVRFLDTGDGHQIGMTVLRIEKHEPYVIYTLSEAIYTAMFTEDGKALVFALPAKRTMDDGSIENNAIAIVKIELDTFDYVRVMGSSYMDYEGFYLSPDHSRLRYSGLHAGGLLYMVNVPVPILSSEDVTYTYVGHNYNVPGGTRQAEKDLSSINRCRSLLYGESMVVFSDDSMFVFDTETTECLKHYPMSGQIVNAYWLDKENGMFEVICSDGWIIDYTLFPDGKAHAASEGADAVFYSITGGTFKYSVKRTVPVGGSLIRQDEGSYLLSISEDNPGQLIRTEYMTDAHGTQMAIPSGDQTYSSYTVIPDTELAMSISTSEKLLVIFDRNTGEVVNSIPYENELLPHNLMVVDQEHILVKSDLYSLDGTKEPYCEPYFGSDDKSNGQYPTEHIVLSDGSILSTGTCYKYDLLDGDVDPTIPEIYPVWINGELISESADPASAVILPVDFLDMDTGEMIAWAQQTTEKKFGANGLLVRYGQNMYPEGDEVVIAKTPRFVVFNAYTKKRTIIEDPYPDSSDRKTVLSNQKPWMAVGYSDGQLCLFDAEAESCTDLSIYAPNEIQALGFSEDDSILAVLRIGGQIDIYDTASGTLSGSVYSSMIHTWTRDEADSWEKELTVSVLDEDTLCISAFWDSEWRSHDVLIDISEQAVTAEIEDVYMIDKDQKLIYAIGKKQLIRFPIYTAEDLIEWAKER